ncbi:nucleoside recognition domain-containing protein [uncultured Treponema sp.]|uniref:nucleoside recognition domain-containing protein n=1 Tax=uncultured Treponema sp. TaxID=162155 RepID=UPI0026010CE5|nr:nucleoside recognition domain-containing protein [uncultured Treponema sp.]
MQSFNLRFQLVSDSQQSILASIAGILEPVFRPIGLGNWKIITSLISGFIAKESVVSTMEILFGDVSAAIKPLAAASLLVFSLLYTPCIAAISAVRRELGTGWAAGVALWQCALAWILAFFVHFIGSFI